MPLYEHVFLARQDISQAQVEADLFAAIESVQLRHRILRQVVEVLPKELGMTLAMASTLFLDQTESSFER